MEKVPVSVIIHTLNESVNIRRTLQNATRWAEEVFVVDSGSTDDTLAIANSFGVKVLQRKHEVGELTAQRNWALANLPFSHVWAYVQDADEIVPDELAEEIRTVVQNDDGSKDGYWVRFRLIWQRRWLKHAALYPTWTMRLLRHAIVRYENRNSNTHPAVQAGRAGNLQAHFLHEDLNSLSVLMKKLNYYSDLEAIEFQRSRDGRDRDLWTGNFFGSPPERRRALKRLYMRLPMRHWVMFSYLYLWRRGFLDGRAGLNFSVLRAFMEYSLDMKIEEAKSAQPLVAPHPRNDRV